MKDAKLRTDSDSVDAAINRVLEAERAAHADVDDCRLRAEAIANAAEARARSVSRSTERRIRAAHGIADRGIADALSALRASGTDTPGQLPTPDAERLAAVVEALAAELTESPQ
ncbi:MAG: hypothetical protein K9L70_14020 [Thiohalocapsa sp.]|jgi:hypothetical protein|nr:hypothetical protein [Thiohalocapsa sp.]MCF7989392.1 hypothetical protein [Thiohalocapsa sp.]